MRKSLLFALVLAVSSGTAANAHEEGVIHLGAKEVSAGGTLAIRGKHLPKAATLRLELRGTLETFALGTVKTDTAGAFTSSPALPADAGTGRYTVVVIAADGDMVARAELVIIPAPAPEATDGHDAMGHAAEAPAAPHATDAMMALPVTRSPAEWAALLALLALGTAAGFALLRGRGEAGPGAD